MIAVTRRVSALAILEHLNVELSLIIEGYWVARLLGIRRQDGTLSLQGIRRT